jgi:secretion/DNA translocation related TadE-like protein
LLVLAAVAVLVLAGVAAVLWTAVSAGRHRVAAAADLSALSAAQVLQAGDPDPCRTAVRIALSHRAEVASCQVDRETVEVVAAVRLDFGSLGQPTIKATARAGPLDPN